MISHNRRGDVNCGPREKFTDPRLFITFWDPVRATAVGQDAVLAGDPKRKG